jgi:hypothetical protein
MPFSKYLPYINYFYVKDVQSSELVEKLLSDLLTTTEGYQKLKN